MRTILEIETALAALPASEREALETRWLVRRFGWNCLGEDERTELLGSLDKAEREIESDRGLSGAELRQSVRAWAGQ